jgi:ABC-2 type transport system ATP-binding protein
MSSLAAPEWVIEADGLARAFGRVRALDGVSFAVRPGEVFGVLGPNGSGKTTTVRVLNGLLAPDAGRARVWGLDPVASGEAVRRRTGVLTETPSLYEPLTARENLAFFGTLHGLSGARLDGRIAATLRDVGLEERADDPAGGLSKGMKQRLAIARAILHEPEVLFLDEPTSGLDPESSELVNTLIRDLGRSGRTIYLCTHLLDEAERLCDRYALFHRGRVLAQGTKAELSARAGFSPGVVLTFDGPVPPLPPLPGEQGRTVDGPRLRLAIADAGHVPDVVRDVVAAGGRLMRVEPHEASLEELYFALMRSQEGGPR